MDMVRSFQLVFDQHPTIGPDILAEDVGAKRTNRSLLRFKFQIDPQRFAENVEVFLLGKPRREIRRLRIAKYRGARPFRGDPGSCSSSASSMRRRWKRCFLSTTGQSTTRPLRIPRDRLS